MTSGDELKKLFSEFRSGDPVPYPSIHRSVADVTMEFDGGPAMSLLVDYQTCFNCGHFLRDGWAGYDPRNDCVLCLRCFEKRKRGVAKR